MKKLITVMISGLSLLACSSDNTTDMVIAQSSGAWTVFTLATGGANPAMGITGSAKAVKVGTDKMKVDLTVAGLPPNMTFGSHIHKLACSDNMGGGHYQKTSSTADGGATDPNFANATNEVWMDFTTDASGKATKGVESSFIPRAGEAKSIMVHAMMTGVGGAAGPKLACLAMPF